MGACSPCPQALAHISHSLRRTSPSPASVSQHWCRFLPTLSRAHINLLPPPPTRTTTVLAVGGDPQLHYRHLALSAPPPPFLPYPTPVASCTHTSRIRAEDLKTEEAERAHAPAISRRQIAAVLFCCSPPASVRVRACVFRPIFSRFLLFAHPPPPPSLTVTPPPGKSTFPCPVLPAVLVHGALLSVCAALWWRTVPLLCGSPSGPPSSSPFLLPLLLCFCFVFICAPPRVCVCVCACVLGLCFCFCSCLLCWRVHVRAPLVFLLSLPLSGRGPPPLSHSPLSSLTFSACSDSFSTVSASTLRDHICPVLVFVFLQPASLHAPLPSVRRFARRFLSQRVCVCVLVGSRACR